MGIKFSNLASTTLASGITNSATTITVADGSVFPALGSGDFFFASIDTPPNSPEIVKVTAVSSNTLTVVRGQDGTTATTHASGEIIALRVVAATLEDLRDNSGETYTAGAGITLTGTVFSNAAPDQTVALTGAGTTTISGTYPNFTITGATSSTSIDTMTGDGTTTALTLSSAPDTENQTAVYIDGVYQSKSNYSVSGTTLTFSTAPPSGSAVEVVLDATVSIGTPSDGTVTSAKLSGDLTTPGDLDVTGTVTADGLTVSNSSLQVKLEEADGSYNPRLVTYFDSSGTHLQHTWSSGATNLIFEVGGSEGSGTERMRIDSSGRLGLGTTSPTSTFRASIKGDYSSIIGGIEFDSGGGDKFTIGHATATSPSATLNVVGAGNMTFKTNNTERMRIDSSGNLLVGTTDTNPANDASGTGVAVGGAGWVAAARDGDTSGMFNRLTSDGNIVTFYKDGTTVGTIGTVSNGLYIASPVSSDSGLRFSGSTVHPCDTAGAPRDNAVDLGYAQGRFDDIYATNGTIETSDRNEKQDIEALSDAEQRVAVAAKGLLRKFRWISSVEENGDDARIHFGIIAQDLQDAFTAEGLDAGRYAMFINSTWTDEETGEERSRMGVRYSELLAFIISAI